MRQLMVVLLFAVVVYAQNSAQAGGKDKAASAGTPVDLASQIPVARAEDVKSMDALLGAIYDVISGPAGDRDWNRFRSMFVPQARFTQMGKNPDGSVRLNLMNVDEFVKLGSDYFKTGAFYEKAIVNRAQTYGNMAQVFSSYESRRAPGEKPFARGINSIQLLNDGKRWWVLSILWDEEREGNPLPAEFAGR